MADPIVRILRADPPACLECSGRGYVQQMEAGGPRLSTQVITAAGAYVPVTLCERCQGTGHEWPGLPAAITWRSHIVAAPDPEPDPAWYTEQDRLQRLDAERLAESDGMG